MSFFVRSLCAVAISADASFLCDKSVRLGDMIKGTTLYKKSKNSIFRYINLLYWCIVLLYYMHLVVFS